VSASGLAIVHRDLIITLSHAKGIYEQGRWNSTTLLRAPYGKMAERILSFVLR
jgi:coniferyl-aldehyde dehydrogenase